MPRSRPHSHRNKSLPAHNSERHFPDEKVILLRNSCELCRFRKVKCSVQTRDGGVRICNRCYKRGEMCVFDPKGRMGRPRTVSSTPPSPSTCLSLPTTPPPLVPSLIHTGQKSLAPSPIQRHGFSPSYHPYTFQGGKPMELTTSVLSYQDNLSSVTSEHGHGVNWFQAGVIHPASSAPTPMSAPPLSHTAMLMAPSLSSDNTSLLGMGGEWSDIGGDNDSQYASAHPHRTHQRGASATTTDFMFENSSVTHGSVGHQHNSHFGLEAPAFPTQLHCFCHSGRAIDDLRAQFRDIVSGAPGAPVVEIALGASHSLSNRCGAASACASCMADQSTATAVVATVSVVAWILQRALPALQAMPSAASPDATTPIMFRPSGPTAAKLALSAMEAEVESLLRASSTVISHLRKSVNFAGSPIDFSLDNMMYEQFEKLQSNLSDLARRVTSLNVEVGASTPVTLGWDGAPHSAPVWDSSSRAPSAPLLV